MRTGMRHPQTPKARVKRAFGSEIVALGYLTSPARRTVRVNAP